MELSFEEPLTWRLQFSRPLGCRDTIDIIDYRSFEELGDFSFSNQGRVPARLSTVYGACLAF